MVVLAAQSGRCATSGCSLPARDVVLDRGEFCAFCRSCRLKLDGRSRAKKANHTRIVRAAERSGQGALFA
jgi:hypothetical protein